MTEKEIVIDGLQKGAEAPLGVKDAGLEKGREDCLQQLR